VERAASLIGDNVRRFTDEFHVELGEKLPDILADSVSLEQAVVNLLQNAGQALKGRKDRVVLKTYFDEGCGSVAIEIEDEGAGIEPELLSKIKEPFFSTKRDVGGMGLGLAITQGVVDRHRGRLVFESSPGRGTKATILLPAERSL
jgi:polar amino acid transport system substrate-binding protein